MAELSDNECWTTLAQLAEAAGNEDLATGCEEAIEHERDHLRKARRWIAAGQGCDADADAGAKMPAREGSGEFTFSAESPADPEGYVMSEEERAQDAGETAEAPRKRARKQKST